MAAPLYAAERALAANSQADRTEAEMTKEVAGREYVRRAQDAARDQHPGRRHRSEKADANGAALALAIDVDVAALTPEEFDALVVRTRNGSQAPNQ